MKTDIIEEKKDDSSKKQLTRGDVAEQLDISIATVRRLEGHQLHPEKNERGVWVFDVAEVMQVASIRSTTKRYRRNDPGEIAARVFEMLEKGQDLRDIVIALRQAPKVVRKLYTEWLVDLRTGEKERRSKESAKRFASYMAPKRPRLEILD